jgi:hypothetical protein
MYLQKKSELMAEWQLPLSKKSLKEFLAQTLKMQRMLTVVW